MATTSHSSASPSANLTNGDSHDALPPAPGAKKAKSKKDKPDENEKAKLIAARLSQLEQEKAGEKDQQAEVDREVKRATRDLSQLMSTVESPLQRLEIVHKKYEELLADMKKVERDHAKNKKRADQLQKDQDKAKSEHNKTVTMKDKLEKLCRELTKENKKVKEDNKRLEETEKIARVDINERLDQMLYDVQDAMNAQANAQGENFHLTLDEVFKIRSKVLADQSDLREMHFKTILRHKDAEISYLNARHDVERKRADAESARARTLTNQVSTFSKTEAELRSQLNIYVEKFKQVEDTLNNSNELFMTFRREMEEMSKKTKRLEKENSTLTRRHDATNRNILEMAEERTRDKEELDKLRNQEVKLRGVVKAMQDQGRSAGSAAEAGVKGKQTRTPLNAGGDSGGGGATAAQAGESAEVDEENTESDYDGEYDDDEDDEEDDDDEEYADDQHAYSDTSPAAAEAHLVSPTPNNLRSDDLNLRDDDGAGGVDGGGDGDAKKKTKQVKKAFGPEPPPDHASAAKQQQQTNGKEPATTTTMVNGVAH